MGALTDTIRKPFSCDGFGSKELFDLIGSFDQISFCKKGRKGHENMIFLNRRFIHMLNFLANEQYEI
jgi:hypothetical protein